MILGGYCQSNRSSLLEKAPVCFLMWASLASPVPSPQIHCSLLVPHCLSPTPSMPCHVTQSQPALLEQTGAKRNKLTHHRTESVTLASSL